MIVGDDGQLTGVDGLVIPNIICGVCLLCDVMLGAFVKAPKQMHPPTTCTLFFFLYDFFKKCMTLKKLRVIFLCHNLIVSM